MAKINDKMDYYKDRKKGEKLLRDIVLGYACNLQATINNKDESKAKINFPIYLLQDINEQLILKNPENNFLELKKYKLPRPREFDLIELLKYFDSSFGRLKCLKGKYVSRIENIKIIDAGVHLDVLLDNSF